MARATTENRDRELYRRGRPVTVTDRDFQDMAVETVAFKNMKKRLLITVTDRAFLRDEDVTVENHDRQRTSTTWKKQPVRTMADRDLQ